MLSVVIPTHESERTVVRTLSCLVPGVVAGLVREVILADSGSGDGIEQVADIAGCRFLVVPGSLGARLKAAADVSRGAWLLFLCPGTVLETGWIAEVERFAMLSDDGGRAAEAAAFRPDTTDNHALGAQVANLLRQALRGLPQPGQGLLLTKVAYRKLGGHDAASRDPERELLRRIGRRRIALLRAGIAGQ